MPALQYFTCYFHSFFSLLLLFSVLSVGFTLLFYLCLLSINFLLVLLFRIIASLIRTSIRSNYCVHFAFSTKGISESATGLRIGHLNVYHLFHKVPDVSLLLKQSSQHSHLFGISKTRLDSRINRISIRVPSYCVMRCDSSQTLHTDIVLYVDQSIAVITRRRADLESEGAECVLVEINDSKSPSLLVGYIYRNPATPTTWFYDFVLMIDKANDHTFKILLTGDCNIDLCKPQPTWFWFSSVGSKCNKNNEYHSNPN